jgi:transposase-like protein
MAIKIEDIKTFADIKKLDDAGLIEYAKLQGVVLPSQPRKDLLGKCASIFLSKRGGDVPVLPLGPKQEEASQPSAPELQPEPVKEKSKKTAPAKKGKKTAAAKDENKSQAEMDLAESFTAAIKEGADFPRCPYCGAAITVDTGVRDGAGCPVCKDCAEKVNNSKEKVMKATAKANKAVAKKAKETISTKTGRKGNTDALKKAREAAPKDAAGFREGSKTSLIFLAIQKGAVKSDKLKTIRPNAIAVIAGFQKKASENSVGIEAVINHDEEAGTYHLKSFKNAEGKTVHVK